MSVIAFTLTAQTWAKRDDDADESEEDWDEEAEVPFDRMTKTKSFWSRPELSTDVAAK